MFLRDANARIGHPNQDMRILYFCLDGNRPMIGYRLYGVREYIAEYLIDVGRMTGNFRQVAILLNQGNPIFEFMGHQR